jgi:hypothetical protein
MRKRDMSTMPPTPGQNKKLIPVPLRFVVAALSTASFKATLWATRPRIAMHRQQTSPLSARIEMVIGDMALLWSCDEKSGIEQPQQIRRE